VYTKLNLLRDTAEIALASTIPRLFFQAFREFAKLLLCDEAYRAAIKTIAARESKPTTTLKKLEFAGLEELKKRAQQLSEYAITTTVPSGVPAILGHFYGLIDQASSPNRALLAPLEQIFCLLLNDVQDHGRFMKKFGPIKHIHDDRYISTEDVFPKFDAWEKGTLYFAQLRQTADWFSLNQVKVFFERYDFQHYDTLQKKLNEGGVNTDALHQEHNTLIVYTHFPNQTDIPKFPNVDEYKSHIRRLLVSVTEIMEPADHIRAHAWDYNSETGEFVVDNDEPILFIITEDPARLLKEICAIKKSTMACVTAYNKLWTSQADEKRVLKEGDRKRLRSVVRQIRGRFEDRGYPAFLIMQKDKNTLGRYELHRSTAYKPV